MTVLIVDDDGGVRELLHRMLVRDFGVMVLEATNGLTALSRLLAERIDLVILDLAMQGMGGIETLEAIRRSPAYASLPVVVLSGQTDEHRVVQASRLGITAFIAKPFTIASLRQRLSPIIAGLRAAPAHHQGRPALLELAPSHRVLVVDRQPEFRAFLHERLRDTCLVSEAEDEAAARKLAIETPHEAICIGATSCPVHVLALRETLGRLPRRVPRIIGVVPSTELESARALGTYDDVVVRSFVADTFDRSLSQVVSEPTHARLLFGATSSGGGTALFDFAREKAETVLSEPVALEGLVPLPETTERWISAAVELEGAGLAWEARASCPFAFALDWAGASLQLRNDQVSESQVLQAAACLATELGGVLREYARDRGLEVRLGPPRVGTMRPNALARGESAHRGGGRRLVTPRRQPAMVVQLAALVTRPV